MRQKNTNMIVIRLTKNQFEKINSTGLKNRSEAIRRCIDISNKKDITPYKKGLILTCIKELQMCENREMALILGNKYEIKDLTEYLNELTIVIKSEISEKHCFPIEYMKEYFIFK